MQQDLITRAQRLIMSPKSEWDIIDGETADPSKLITGYVAPLAAIPAIAMLIGMSFVGVNMMGASYHAPFGAALGGAIVSFIFAIAGVFIFAIIINALAPAFGAQSNFNQALKVSAYAPTAGWLAGVFAIVPMLAILSLVGAVYSLYLLFVGLPKMMKPPAEKATTYTIVSIVVAIVAWIILSAFAGVFMPRPGVGAFGGA